MLAWRDLDDVEAGGSEVHAHNVASIWAPGRARGHACARRSPPASRQRTVRAGYTVVRKAGRYLVFPRSVAAEITGRLGPCDGLVEIWNGMPFLSPLWWHGPAGRSGSTTCTARCGRCRCPPTLAKAGSLLEERIAPPFYRRPPIVTLSQSSKRRAGRRARLQRPSGSPSIEPGIDPALRARAATRSPTPLVVAVGRLVPVKDFPRLIR